MRRHRFDMILCLLHTHIFIFKMKNEQQKHRMEFEQTRLMI